MKKKILIADDNIDIVQMIVNHLTEESKFSVINASNGKIAYSLAEEYQPDLILMDWDMPIMDGIEATRNLKLNKNTSHIPVIIATGQMTTSEDLQIALEAGAIDYVRKPIDFIELSARINTALRIIEQNQSIQNLLKQEIELKNRKLSTTSMLIVEKNGLLQDFTSDLNLVEKKIEATQTEALKHLKTLKRRINSHLDVDNSWDTFRLHFDEVHPNFFDTLSTRYKQLSQKDHKLAAYVKLGMDNKQISRLLNIAPGSTRTALTRLKQKMGLNDDVNLRNTLSEIK